jgi:hypothetical protein
VVGPRSQGSFEAAACPREPARLKLRPAELREGLPGSVEARILGQGAGHPRGGVEAAAGELEPHEFELRRVALRLEGEQRSQVPLRQRQALLGLVGARQGMVHVGILRRGAPGFEQLPHRGEGLSRLELLEAGAVGHACRLRQRRSGRRGAGQRAQQREQRGGSKRAHEAAIGGLRTLLEEAVAMRLSSPGVAGIE